MITAVDTDVLLDVFAPNPRFVAGSQRALRRCLVEGRLEACPAVWAETAAAFCDEAIFQAAMRELGVRLSDFSAASAWRAAATWRQYRANGGARERMVTDFLIGAHALHEAERLLTRDRGFFRQYFRELVVVDPAEA